MGEPWQVRSMQSKLWKERSLLEGGNSMKTNKYGNVEVGHLVSEMSKVLSKVSASVNGSLAEVFVLFSGKASSKWGHASVLTWDWMKIATADLLLNLASKVYAI